MLERELELGTGALVATDHGTLHACRKVYDLAKKAKITPILGLEAYFRDDNCPILLNAGVTKDEKGTLSDWAKYYHLTIHFLDQAAFEAGIRILSQADLRAERHGKERKALFDWAMLEELGGYNVTMTTGCLVGIVQRHILQQEDLKVAAAYYDRLRSIVKPGNFYVEVFPHDCSMNWEDGIFVSLADGTHSKYWQKKKLRTNKGEYAAIDLAKEFRRKDHGHKQLIGIMNNRKWEELPSPIDLVHVEHIQEFLPNECRPWAPDGDVQNGINRIMMIWAKRHGDKILIADDSHFAYPDEKIIQDVRLAQDGPWRFWGSYHRQSSEEAFAHFNRKLNVNEQTFEGWVENSYEWRDRFKDFVLDQQPSLPTKFYEVNYPKHDWYKEGASNNSVKYAMELIKRQGRMDWSNKEWVSRLKSEIQVLHNNGTIDLVPYFFLDNEVCSLFESWGELTGPGRGSAAGLGLSYLLGITHVDPIRFGLSQERFITKDRIASGKLPDIDQDVPKSKRDRLIDPEHGWLFKRFGDHAAQISVDSTLKLRMAVQDVARFQIANGNYRNMDDVFSLTKRFEMPPMGVTDHDFVLGYESDDGIYHKGSIETDEALKEYVVKYPEDWEIVKSCLGLPRQKGRHACGFVVAGKPIPAFIPLTSVSGVRVTAYTAGTVEASGGVKMDFLGLGALDDIGGAIQLIQKRHGHTVDMSKYKIVEHEEDLVGWSGPFVSNKRFSVILNGKRVPCQRLVPFKGELVDIWDLPEDQGVFADVATGNTPTVFQYNTPGAIQWLAHFAYQKTDGRYAIDSIESMAAFTALDRPGPLDMMVKNPENDEEHNLLVEYARRARGAAPSKDVLEVFDTLLPETYGIMVYQEQLQRVYQSLTGCSGAEAEEFRSDVAKKKQSKIEKAYGPFIEKASKALGKENAEAAWKFFITWAQYGFNKSHAVCYAVIGYACAFLKHHYELEWWTSVLSYADRNEVNEKFWKHAGHLIDLPDLSKSGLQYEIKNERIQAPLSLIAKVGEKAHEQLVKYAPYTSLDDFCRKIMRHRLDTAVEVTKLKKVKVKKPDPENPKKKITVEEEREVTELKLGRNALNRGVIYTLMLSDSMASILPKTKVDDLGNENELMIFDYINMYYDAMKAAYEDMMPRGPDGKVKKFKSMTKLEREQAASFLSISPLQRFQTKKAVLPVYSENLIERLDSFYVPGFHKDDEGAYCYKWQSGESDEVVPIRFVRADHIESIDNAPLLPDPPYIGAAVAYIEGSNHFTFQKGNGPRKEACKFQLDIEGHKMEIVKWGGKSRLPDKFRLPENAYAGSVAIVIMTKYKEGRPFVLEDVIVVQPSLAKSSQLVDITEDEESPEEQ